MGAQPLLNVIATALITALLSGIVAALVSSYLTEGKERWSLRREKIEQIYISAILYGNSLGTAFGDYYLVIKGQTGINEINDMAIKRGGSGEDFRQLQMNILLYEPTLKASWRALIGTRDEINVIVRQIKAAFKEGDDLSDFGRPFHAAMLKLSKNIDGLENAVVTRGREIAEEKGQAERLLLAIRDTVRTAYARPVSKVRSGFNRGMKRIKLTRSDRAQ